MIQPLQQDEALLADIAGAPRDANNLDLWWLGQSGFLIQHHDVRLLVDPYLSDSLTEKYASTDKPHVRMTERCVAPEKLTGIRYVLASHAHTDHLDGQTLQAVAQGSPDYTLLAPGPILDEARKRLGHAVVELAEFNAHDDLHWDDIRLCGVPAAHNEIRYDAFNHCECIGFIITLGPFTIYHSGDTLWHPDVLELVRAFDCDVMLLPINGHKPERRVAGNLNGTEAAAFAKACQARLVVPCHYEMFEFNTDTPAEFIHACERLAQPCRVLRCGERLSLRRD